METVVLGMSGGVDSTLSAIKLKEQGFAVVGVTLRLWDTNASAKAIDDAIAQAHRIGIEHHILDCREEFRKEIVQRFVQAYLLGQTPSPCAWCNPLIKWKFIADFADRIGAFHISSGHYINVVQHNGHTYVAKAADPLKDQSYYLWMLQESILKRLIQPLGGITKKETKAEIKARNFADLVPQKESMSVCFLAGMDYRSFLFKEAQVQMSSIKEGNIVDETGRIVGTHQGYPYYTVGQKRGITLNEEREAYISSIDYLSNTLSIGTKKSLNKSSFTISGMHLIDTTEITPETPLEVKVRGLGLNPEGYGYVAIRDDKGYVMLENPAWAISPGQPVVFYIEDRLVGGGIAE